MRNILVVASLFCSFDVHVALADDRADKKNMQGKWIVVTAKTGSVDGDKELVGRTLAFTGDKVVFFNRAGESEGEFNFTLDSAKTPKHIDFQGMERGKKVHLAGIYVVDSGRMRLCWSSRPDGERPREFEKGGGSEALRSCLLQRHKE